MKNLKNNNLSKLSTNPPSIKQGVEFVAFGRKNSTNVEQAALIQNNINMRNRTISLPGLSFQNVVIKSPNNPLSNVEMRDSRARFRSTIDEKIK